MSTHSPVRNHYSPIKYEASPEVAIFRLQPTLDLFPNRQPLVIPQGITPKLFLVPTLDLIEGEEPDAENPPRPSALDELPELEGWVTRYVISVIEILGGRRSASQLDRWSHRLVHLKMLSMIGIFESLPKIRRIYIAQPHEGIAETTVTIRINERVRSLVLRFEGVDQRWLCTEFQLL